jgi:DNA-binding XRE family transcriptional regulator
MSKKSKGTMICTESPEQTDKRIDLMLREMVVEEGLSAFEANRELKVYTLQEMADYIGVGYKTLWDIEKSALNKFKKNMLQLGIKNGNTGI